MFNSGQFCVNMINLYANYTTTGKWDKKDVSSQKFIIALATALANERAKKSQTRATILASPREAEEIITPTFPHGV